jgi:hypothetical protein
MQIVNTFAAIVDRSRFNNSCLRLLKISDLKHELLNRLRSTMAANVLNKAAFIQLYAYIAEGSFHNFR